MRALLVLLVLFYCLLFGIPLTISSSCLDINTASKEELQGIIGVGPVIAQKIIDARPFSSVDELVRVSGIAEKKLANIKEQGLACVQSEPEEDKDNDKPLEQPQSKIILPSEARGKKEQSFFALPSVSKGEKENEVFFALSYPQANPVNKEIEIMLAASNFKSATYDIKISIEKENVLSDIYNEKEGKWQSSHYYINNLFSGSSFEGTLKLKIREEGLNFQGEADILARIRENGKSNYLEHKDKINLTEPEHAPEERPLLTSKKDLAAVSQQIPKSSDSPRPFLIALSIAVFFGIIILILKKMVE